MPWQALPQVTHAPQSRLFDPSNSPTSASESPDRPIAGPAREDQPLDAHSTLAATRRGRGAYSARRGGQNTGRRPRGAARRASTGAPSRARACARRGALVSHVGGGETRGGTEDSLYSRARHTTDPLVIISFLAERGTCTLSGRRSHAHAALRPCASRERARGAAASASSGGERAAAPARARRNRACRGCAIRGFSTLSCAASVDPFRREGGCGEAGRGEHQLGGEGAASMMSDEEVVAAAANAAAASAAAARPGGGGCGGGEPLWQLRRQGGHCIGARSDTIKAERCSRCISRISQAAHDRDAHDEDEEGGQGRAAPFLGARAKGAEDEEGVCGREMAAHSGAGGDTEAKVAAPSWDSNLSRRSTPRDAAAPGDAATATPTPTPTPPRCPPSTTPTRGHAKLLQTSTMARVVRLWLCLLRAAVAYVGHRTMAIRTACATTDSCRHHHHRRRHRRRRHHRRRLAVRRARAADARGARFRRRIAPPA